MVCGQSANHIVCSNSLAIQWCKLVSLVHQVSCKGFSRPDNGFPIGECHGDTQVWINSLLELQSSSAFAYWLWGRGLACIRPKGSLKHIREKIKLCEVTQQGQTCECALLWSAQTLFHKSKQLKCFGNNLVCRSVRVIKIKCQPWSPRSTLLITLGA